MDTLLPSDWRVVFPEDIVSGERSIVSGPFGSNIGKRFFVESGIPVIRGNNLTLGRKRFVDEGFVFLTEEKAKQFKNCQALPGDIVFTAAGTLGQVGLIPQNTKYPVYIISNKQLRVRPDPNIAFPGYLYYWFSSEGIRNHIIGLNTGSSVPLITLGKLRSVPINLPPIPTQRKIAAILSAYDDLIENNLRRIKILEEMAQNLYREWFVKFRFPGHQQARFTDSPLGRIPERWEVKTLGKLADQIRDGVNPNAVAPETPYFGLEHLPRKSISLADWGFASEVQSTKLLFSKGDILFGKIRPYFHKVGVAPLPGVCSSDTIVIRPISADWFGLVLGCASSNEFIEHATATSQGTKMPRANWDVLVKYQIPIPSQPILGQFNEFMSELVSQLHNFVFRNRNLRRTRDLLLPRLISGEVDVSELDITIPEEAPA